MAVVINKLPVHMDIWKRPARGQWTEEDWSAIINHLTQALSTYLGQTVKLIDSSIIDGEALCCSIRGETMLAGPLELTWEGRLGLELINDRPHVSAFLFLFSQGKRLRTTGQSGSYLLLTYQPDSSGVPRWHSDGWQEDVYGEFESINGST